jgi:hypothetical protein
MNPDDVFPFRMVRLVGVMVLCGALLIASCGTAQVALNNSNQQVITKLYLDKGYCQQGQVWIRCN